MAFLTKYGVARHIYVPVIKRAVVDFAVSADWTPAAGDVKISKDGGAAANVTNLPTAITMGNTAMWDFSLTATELQAAQVSVTVADSATKAVEDTMFDIETYGNASAEHPFDLATAVPDVNVTKVGGTTQTARDLGASVLLSAGTGTGQLDFTSGVVKANLVQILATALTETAGQLAGGFKKFFNIATPASTMDALTLVTTATNVTTVNGLAANVITAASINAAAMNGKGDWNIGKTGYALSAAGVQAIWDALTSALTTASSIGKLLVDNINATISSRLAAANISLSAGAVTVGTNNDKTGYAIGTGGIASAAFAANAVDAAAVATDAVTEIRDAIANVAMVEPTAVPAVTATLKGALSWLLAMSRNKITQTATTQTLLGDDGSTTIAASTHSDDGTTHTRGEFA